MARTTSSLYLFLVLYTIPLFGTCAEVGMGFSMTKFKAAVYSHALVKPPDSTSQVSRAKALENIGVNLEIFKLQADTAGAQGVNILVFPEDGVYGYSFDTRDSIFPYLEYIPDPAAQTWSPCEEPDRYPNTEVQYTLSCMAKNNSLYLVANIGDKQPCESSTDPECPADGRYQFNTGVAYGPSGALLAKYHKSHLFYEDQFDQPKSEIVYFDTPFGRFGMMTCFDVLFYDPGIPMILSHNISNIVFPTAWMDALPLLSAIGFHSSFARALGVNFLSANLHLPRLRFHGSGIYTPDGMKVFHYGNQSVPGAALSVTELDVLESPRPNIDIPARDRYNFPLPPPHSSCSDNDADVSDSMEIEQTESSFESLLFFDRFMFQTLNYSSGLLRVCQREVCCELEYSFNVDDFGKELFAFGAFDGLHTYEGQYYFQICALVKCADHTNRSTCGSVTHTSQTVFNSLRITGTMKTYFIHPQVVLSNEMGDLQLAEAETWSFRENSLWTNTALDRPLLSAALYGRYYSRDHCLDQGSLLRASLLTCLAMCLLSLLAVYSWPSLCTH